MRESIVARRRRRQLRGRLLSDPARRHLLVGKTRTIFYVGREPEPGEKPLDTPPQGVDLDLGFAFLAVRTGQRTSAEPGEGQVK